MTTTLNITPPATASPPRLDHFLMHDASWNLYQSFIKETGNRNLRVTYSDRSMEIMSPLPEHEQAKRLVGRLVEMLALAFGIPVFPFGSATYSYKNLKKGLEPDDCFYLGEHEAQMRGKRRLNLPADPPPDLVVEIDISYRAVDREKIYAAMKVPEIWLCDGEKIQCLVLDAHGQYQPADFGLAFPSVRVAELMRWVRLAYEKGLAEMVRGFNEWVKTLPNIPGQP